MHSKIARRDATSASNERETRFAKEFPLYAEYSLLRSNVNMRKLMKGSPELPTELEFYFLSRVLPFKIRDVCSGIFRI